MVQKAVGRFALWTGQQNYSYISFPSFNHSTFHSPLCRSSTTVNQLSGFACGDVIGLYVKWHMTSIRFPSTCTSWTSKILASIQTQHAQVNETQKGRHASSNATYCRPLGGMRWIQSTQRAVLRLSGRVVFQIGEVLARPDQRRMHQNNAGKRRAENCRCDGDNGKDVQGEIRAVADPTVTERTGSLRVLRIHRRATGLLRATQKEHVFSWLESFYASESLRYLRSTVHPRSIKSKNNVSREH